MGHVGSYAPNLREGKRSEYLAHYFFSSLGTSVPVPSPEDTGLDLHCTIADVVGQRAWPRCFYTVQVKSDSGPWCMDSQESVAWLADQPFPIFLCVVEKKIGRFRLYQTLPRHFLRAHPPLPDRFELVPGDGADGKPEFFKRDQHSYSLSAPILDFGLEKFLDAEFLELAKSVIRSWVEWDNENTYMRLAGLQYAMKPTDWKTNEVMSSKGKSCSGVFPKGEEWLVPMSRLAQQLTWTAWALNGCGQHGLAIRMALVLKHIVSDFPLELSFWLQELNQHFGLPHNRGQEHMLGLEKLDSAIEQLLPSTWKKKTKTDSQPDEGK